MITAMSFNFRRVHSNRAPHIRLSYALSITIVVYLRYPSSYFKWNFLRGLSEPARSLGLRLDNITAAKVAKKRVAARKDRVH